MIWWGSLGELDAIVSLLDDLIVLQLWIYVRWQGGSQWNFDKVDQQVTNYHAKNELVS